MQTQNFLFEIGCEELPPGNLRPLSEALKENIRQGLIKAELKHDEIQAYATPRRLAVIIKNLASQQPNQKIERKGPAVTAPAAAIEGFLRSCDTTPDRLDKENARFVYRYTETGKPVTELMPAIVSQAIANLPIPKPMRWGDQDIAFIRPVHWVIMLYGDKIIPATILGLETSNKTYGHRFHHPEEIKLKHADDYLKKLEKAKVIADFDKHKEIIRRQIIEHAHKKDGNALINDKLLDEVTRLVEWPVAILGKFSESFLTIPKEVLIAAMEDHQRCFPIQTSNHSLLPYFIAVSNIESKNPETVIHGNERVINARLSDAKFFYETDCKLKLEARLESLKHVIFQTKLGSLYDKSQRIEKLAGWIVERLNSDAAFAKRAGLLCKADLVTCMVGEFPELQGIMGYYYAKHDDEAEEVTVAIRDHYLPRFSGDKLPNNLTSCAVALADRMDTLVGIFGINQKPTGDKDPFGLRRAAIAVLRILIDARLNLNLKELLTQAYQNYQPPLANQDITQVHNFILEKLDGLYHTYFSKIKLCT